MPDPYEIAWTTGNILVMRRHGYMSIEQANKYFADAKRAIGKARGTWGLVVDTTDAATQSEDVIAVLQEQMNYTAKSGARRTAIVTGKVVASMQTRRLNAMAGYAPGAITFHESYDEAYADVQRALTEA
jgi:hypothetical protein